ncbi:hypothetical protein CRM22_003014 [Opisthorchis felineus]|uniref:Uncharacterized protein n=1 Tax=Opisthorchis felineus TaxID=147828 RepID=A0A4S2M3A1_OPIFE|nr:hypothetical protein CRM22_003014 [Opisthorchis felineus]
MNLEAMSPCPVKAELDSEEISTVLSAVCMEEKEDPVESRSDIMSGAITIRCNDAEYEEEHYLLGPGTSDLMIHVHPNHSVLFVEQHKYLAFCVGFPNKPDCFDHRPGISPTLCTAHQKNVTISFRSRLQLTTEVSEGAYDIKCHHQQTFLNKSTTILVLHNGSFVWDCSVAPRIIYLESKLNSYVICRWKMNVTDKWKPFLNRLPHKYPSIYCRDNMRSLRFDGGVLLVNHSQRIQGVFRIFCHEKLVIEDLIITDRFSDLRLSIYPELTAIDKSVSGTLQARLEWRGATRHNVFQLRERFPVNCSYFTMKNDSHSTRYFTDPIRFAELPQGELHVKCTCSALKLTNQLVKFVFSSPVWQRISHSDDSKGSLNLTPYRAVSQLLGCLKPAGRLSFVGTVLQLRLTQLSPTELTTLCPGYEHNVTVYFNDPKEVTLIIKNRGKQIHYTGEVHSYICILEGPPVDAIRSERHEPRWISRESSRSAVVWKNVLHIAEEASVGHYHYQCLYNKNGLKLENGLRFSVFDKDLMTLDIDPLGDSTFVYHTRGIRPAFRCHTKYLDTNILHRPVWRLLHGQSDFVIKDETDYTQSQSAVYLVDDKEGQSTFQCSLRVKEKCLSRLLIFWRFNLPQTTVLEEVTDNGEVIGWSCVTDGYPKEASTYQITILEQPSNSFYQIHVNELALTPYSVFGQLRVQCIAKGVWHRQEIVVNGTHNLTYVGNDRMTAKHKALFQIHPKQVFYTMVLVSITFHFGIYVYFLRRTLKDRKADQVPVNFAMLDDVTLNIHEVNLGWTDFGHLCSLVREFSIINKMCLIFAESDRQSPVSSSPTDIQPAEVGQDHSLTNSDSISTDSDIKGLYQDELPTLHDALMKYHDNRDRRSILLAGEHPLIRFSMMINEPLTNQVDEPVPHSSSSQTERRQNE